ncbi:hypothetical protein SAMN05421784_10644 [Xenorhabdus koppenhoeferi]|uniref:Uncharacterized protein n=1 Tax=Xenorhabdus koppenhoeferi TaxID=351659 RepID=A0A1I7G0X3_9GAMM|nr:hypothetical protein [Xenorhabdus koppenhoeferi]SFU41966.1 hypothetical protein SAMN05421784_10644 [Xenorhabdus koppenhoeferi]
MGIINPISNKAGNFRHQKVNLHDRKDTTSQKWVMAGQRYIPVVFQDAALLAALTHPGHIVIYAPGDSFLAVALHLEIQWV